MEKDLIAQIDVNSETLRPSVKPWRITLDAPMLLSTLKGPLFKRFCLVRSLRASVEQKRIAIAGQALLNALNGPALKK